MTIIGNGYTNGFQGNPAAIPLDEQKINAAKAHSKKNAAGALADNYGLTKQESPFEMLKTWALGFFIPGFISKFTLEPWITALESKDTPLSRALDKIDKFSKDSKLVQSVGNAFNTVKNSWVGKPFRKIAEHCRKHAHDVQPKFFMARQSVRSYGAEHLENAISDVKSTYQTHNNIGRQMIDAANKNSKLGGFFNAINIFGFGFEKHRYQAKVPRLMQNVDKTLDMFKDRRNELPEKVMGNYERSLAKYTKAIETHGKDSRQAARAARGIIKCGSAVIGECNSLELSQILRSFKTNGISAAEARTAIENIAEKAKAKELELFKESLQKYQETIQNHGVKSKETAAAAKELVEKGTSIVGKKHSKKIARLIDSVKAEKLSADKASGTIMSVVQKHSVNFGKKYFQNMNRYLVTSAETSGRSFLSKSLLATFKGFGRIIRWDPLGAFFMGAVIKKTVDAEKGDKLATFMEGMASEVVPYWMLMAVTSKLAYVMPGILKAVGTESKLGKIFGWPIRKIGNFMEMGLGTDGTSKMSAERAAEIFKRAPNEVAKKKAVEEFSRLSKIIESGKGGPSGWFDRVISQRIPPWKREFWKGASSIHKQLNALVKANTGLTKRLGFIAQKCVKGPLGFIIRPLIVGFAIMPLFSEPLKKLSHKLFGKSKETLKMEAAEKAAKEAQNQPAETPSPMVNDFLNQTVTQPVNTDTTISMIDKYADNYVNNAKPNTAPPINQTVKPVSKFDSFAVPAPITTNPQISAGTQAALADVDKAILEAEKILGNH